MKIKSVLVVVLCVVVCCLLFLIALNGRYRHIGDGRVLDSWKKEVILPASSELPVVINGKKIIN